MTTADAPADTGRAVASSAARGAVRERVMTWGVSTTRRRPGDLLTRGDVCHVHGTRDAAEQCGAAAPGAPDLVRLERISRYVYRVAWSLSDASGGQLRRAGGGPASLRPVRRRPIETGTEAPGGRCETCSRSWGCCSTGDAGRPGRKRSTVSSTVGWPSTGPRRGLTDPCRKGDGAARTCPFHALALKV